MRLDEIELITKKIGKSLYELLISGGEPFLRQDLYDIVRLFKINCDIKKVNIPTNGFMTDTIVSVITDLMKDFPALEVSLKISLDSLYEKHDRSKGIPGLFERIVKLSDELKSIEAKYPAFKRGVGITLTKENENSINDIIEFVAEKMNIHNISINYPRDYSVVNKDIVGIDPELYIKSARDLLASQYKNFKNDFLNNVAKAIERTRYDTIYKIARDKRPVFRCMAGRKIIVIDEIGDVYPCEIFPLKLGNLRQEQYDLNALLAKKAGYLRKKLNVDKCFCTWECVLHWDILSSLQGWRSVFERYKRGL